MVWLHLYISLIALDYITTVEINGWFTHALVHGELVWAMNPVFPIRQACKIYILSTFK